MDTFKAHLAYKEAESKFTRDAMEKLTKTYQDALEKVLKKLMDDIDKDIPAK